MYIIYTFKKMLNVHISKIYSRCKIANGYLYIVDIELIKQDWSMDKAK